MSVHVSTGMGKSLGFHAIDFLARESVAGRDLNGGALAGAALAGVDGEDAVGIDEELDFELGNAGRHGGNAAQLERGERTTVFHKFAFALQDMKLDVGLAID